MIFGKSARKSATLSSMRSTAFATLVSFILRSM
jgi:hypothetical protein